MKKQNNSIQRYAKYQERRAHDLRRQYLKQGDERRKLQHININTKNLEMILNPFEFQVVQHTSFMIEAT